MKACTFTSDWQQHADEPVRHLMTPETISQPWRAEIEVMVYLFSGGMAEADAIAQGEMWRQLGEKLIARGTEMRDMGLGIPEWWAQKCWLEDDEPPKAPVLTLVPKSPAT